MIKPWEYRAGATATLDAFRFERREPGENDVLIEILHCGVCHSDLHTARKRVEGDDYPSCRATRSSAGCRRWAPGEGVPAGRSGRCRLHGRLVPELSRLHGGLGKYCRNEIIFTTTVRPAHGRDDLRGYSSCIVVDERFVLRVPTNLDLPR